MRKTFQTFVETIPESVTTAEVVKRALAAGYTKANAAKVHSARYIIRQRRLRRHAPMLPATGGARVQATGDAELTALRRQIYMLGLDRARPVFDACVRAFEAMN